MSLKITAATAAFALLNGAALADTTVSAEYASGNLLLNGPQGSGKTAGLRLETSNGSGLLSVRLGQARETAFNSAAPQSITFPGLASVTGNADWNKQTRADFIEVKKSFRVFDRADVSYGAYAGQASGTAEYNAAAHVALHAQTVRIPGQTYMGMTLPATTITLPGSTRDVQQHKSRSLKSPYGGALVAAELPLPTSTHTQLRLSASGQAGADRVGYGAGAAFVVTTRPTRDDRQMPNGACSGKPYAPRNGLALTLAVCADETVSSRLYDAEKKEAQNKAAAIAGYGSKLVDYSNQLRSRSGGQLNYNPAMPAYTATDILNTLGVPNPTLQTQVAVTLGVAGNFRNATYAAYGSVPVKGLKNPQYGVSVGYKF